MAVRLPFKAGQGSVLRNLIMANETESTNRVWKTTQAYTMAAICLAVGIALGYLFRGSASRPANAVQTAQANPATGAPANAPHQMPSLEDMKRMADKKAEPLLAKLKDDPKNPEILNQIGMLYKATHQFKEAAGYFQRSLDADPKNVSTRTDLASCLFYEGDADGAIQQLQQSLAYDPKDANSLFNLGMIRLQAKNDPSGAVTAWKQLLKMNPTLAQDKKAAVEKLIAQARQPKASE